MSTDAIAHRTLCVDSAHPCLPGHFPDSPIVPGVVLLSEVLAEQRRRLPHARVVGIKKLKFVRLLFPGEAFTVEFGATGADNLRFKCRRDGELLAEGNFALEPSATSTPADVRSRA